MIMDHTQPSELQQRIATFITYKQWKHSYRPQVIASNQVETKETRDIIDILNAEFKSKETNKL